MDNVKGTTARFRRSFRYPTDDSSSADSPEVMDEEEQETLIQTLAEENTARNGQFRLLLLALPCLSAVPYLATLFRARTFLLSVLSLTSLFSTAYLLYALPPADTGIQPLDRWASGGSPTALAEEGEGEGEGEADHQRSTRRRASSFFFEPRHRTPLEAYLPLLNAGLCAVLVLTGLLTRGGAASARLGPLGLGDLPAIVYGVVLAAKVVMAGVDPERELARLRYEYKGA